MEHRIRQYALEEGALEIQYIEEFFGEFDRKKTASEIMARLEGRGHSILMAEAPLPDDPTQLVPVSFKVAHELRSQESEPKLADLVERLRGFVQFEGRRILYSWIGGTRSDWRGQGHFRALTEQQEVWAIEQEQVLRDARDARSPEVRRHQVRAERHRQPGIEGLP
jgi:hypothetical protein